jgi:uncharacterized membrane protein
MKENRISIRIGSGLLPLNLLVIALVIIILFFPSSVLRTVLGVPFMLLAPGYALVLVLFPKKVMGGIERAILSFGLSIAVISFVGLILNYTPWGIKLETMIYSLTFFIFVMSIIAWIRTRRLAEQDRLGFEFQLKTLGLGNTVWEKPLSILLVISILVVLGTFSYAVIKPKAGERFTEFYLLGAGGKAADYPSELVIGEVAKVAVGIINQEQQSVSYHVEIRLAGTQIGELGPVTLEHGQKWEQEVSIIPETVGKNQKVEFQLFKEGEEKPGKLLHFWLHIKEKT